MAKAIPASDHLPPTAGVRLPKEMQRDLPPLGPHGNRPLVKHILELKALHPEVEIPLRTADLANLDDAALERLLADLSEQLGID